MIQYSPRAIRGLAYLFRKYNDIEIYVEDETCRGMYEVLFERMLDSKARISRVFQLKGKHNVIELCKTDQLDSKRRRIYIIDGDFDSINRKLIEPNLKYFYQLRVYCSENLVLTDVAVQEVAFESLTNFPKNEVIKIVEYEFFLEESKRLISLFAWYLVAYKLKPQIETSGYNIHRLLENDKINLSAKKICEREKEIKALLLAEFPQKQIEREFLRAKQRIQRYPLRFISGKSYLLPLLHNYLKSKAKFAGNISQLKIRLARYCKLDIDQGLVQAIRTESQRKSYW
jgi:hypothetical protein